jgi:hypothetical protein
LLYYWVSLPGVRTAQLTKPIITFRSPLLAAPSARWCIIIAVALLAAAWVAILGIPVLPGGDALIVHYTTTFGIDALGSWRDLLRLPLTGTALFLVNLTIARMLQPEAESRKPETMAGALRQQAHRSTVALSPASSILVVANIPLQFIVLLGSVLLWRANTT